RITKTFFIFFLMNLSGAMLVAQTNYLSRRVSFDLPNCTLEVALREIGKAGNFRFSYDADLIRGSQMVRLKATNTPVNKLLRDILGKDVRPREVGNHVILVSSKKAGQEKTPFPDIRVDGNILDAFDRKPLADVTVYEVVNKKSAITTESGVYKLVIPSGKKVRALTYCKSGYADTIVFIWQASRQQVDVLLRPVEVSLSRIAVLPGLVTVNVTDQMGLVQWLVPRETMVNSQNLEVRSSRTFQASVIPYIGTNWKVTGSITNRFSLNLLAGYTGGLNGLEVGGLLNISRNTIRGLQIGGLANIAGGRGKGCQIGGLFNFDFGQFEGVQVGGLFNYVPDTISGLQVGGLANIITGRIKGIQISGLANIVTNNCDGWQMSGLLNLTLKDIRKVQISGLVNYGNNLDGLQLAGLINVSRKHNNGVQIAGFLNYSTFVHGVQIGLINVANTVERGVPIGLFSYVQNGYHLFEVSGNEIFYGNVAFKSGTRSFYNFVQAGIGSDYKLQGSYGVGTILKIAKKFSLNVDASAGFVYHPTDTIYHGLLLKFNPALEFRLVKHFAIFMGPSYNCFVFSKGKPSATSRGLSTYDFYFKSTENASIQMWIGGVLGVRF
ncbi:MAG: hypothetical protein NTW16_03420, partial [Bacteroidetes bacterium]|nr:hypothetical protein [Bacteroidota bacterium]